MKKQFFLLPILFIVLSSCDDGRFYEQYQGIPNGKWHKDDKKSFEVHIPDTMPLYDFYVNIRNTGAYPFANLFVFLDTHFPDGGRISRDTLELLLASPSGKWLGKGSGDIYENRFLFRKNVAFADSGTYRFEFQHAMRKDVLEEIMDIGLRIEKKDFSVK